MQIIHSKNLFIQKKMKIIHSKKIFIQVKNKLSPRATPGGLREVRKSPQFCDFFLRMDSLNIQVKHGKYSFSILKVEMDLRYITSDGGIKC